MQLRKKQPSRRRPQQQGSVSKQYTHYYGKEESRQNIHRTEEEKSSKRVLNRVPKAQKKSLPTYIAIVVIIATVFYSSLLSKNTVVLLPDDAALYPKEVYENLASDILHDDILSFSKITFNSNAFANKLKEKSPEIQDVSVRIPLIGRKLVVGLGFVRPAYIFSVNNKEYVVGTNGVIVAEARRVDPSSIATLRKIEDRAPLKAGVGTPVLLGSDVAFIDTITQELTNKQVTIDKMVLPQGAGELHVYVTNPNHFIKFSITGDAKQQVGSYFAVMKNLGDAKPSEYVDVRVGERIFVK